MVLGFKWSYKGFICRKFQKNLISTHPQHCSDHIFSVSKKRTGNAGICRTILKSRATETHPKMSIPKNTHPHIININPEKNKKKLKQKKQPLTHPQPPPTPASSPNSSKSSLCFTHTSGTSLRSASADFSRSSSARTEKTALGQRSEATRRASPRLAPRWAKWWPQKTRLSRWQWGPKLPSVPRTLR